MYSLDVFFNPKSVAIVGATPKTGKVGRVILENFKRKFKGKVYAVNPKYREILGIPSYPTLKDIPEDVELGVIAIPAPSVPQVVKDAADKNVKGLIIISGGFSEVGEEGRKLEEKIKKIIIEYGIRVIGPNCLGVYDAFSGVDTFFLPEERMRRPIKGPIAIISQSGAFAATILDWAAPRGIGIGKAVSYGNKIDVDDIELMRYFEKDPTVKAILIYIEGLKRGQGLKFIETAREVVKSKPILILKGGKTKRGVEAAASHTAALAGTYELYKAAFKQAGIIEADGFEDLFDMAKALTTQPPAQGRRVLVLTDAGGMGVMATDALESLGLEVPELSDKIKSILREKLPPHCIIRNPVDLTGDATNERYKIVLDTVLSSNEVDIALVITQMQVPTLTEKIVDYIYESTKYGKPIIVCMAGSEFTEEIAKKIESKNIPVYPSPERAAKAVWALYKYNTYRARMR